MSGRGGHHYKRDLGAGEPLSNRLLAGFLASVVESPVAKCTRVFNGAMTSIYLIPPVIVAIIMSQRTQDHT